MIQFEITESPDQDVVGDYHLFKNEIYLGTLLTDIIIKDPEIRKSHAFIEVVENVLLFHPQKDVSFYLLNGKRALTIRKLKAGDVIQIGKTKIKIIGFNFSANPSRKEILDNKLQQFMNQQDARLEVIEKLGQLMK
jgi:hypothetical protein